MDYRFSKDFYGAYSVELPSEQQLFIPWLSDEVATNNPKIDRIIAQTEKLLAKKGWEYRLDGIDLHLCLTREEAIIEAHNHHLETDFDDDLNHCDDLSTSSCGLDDLLVLMLAWRDFINGK